MFAIIQIHWSWNVFREFKAERDCIVTWLEHIYSESKARFVKFDMSMSVPSSFSVRWLAGMNSHSESSFFYSFYFNVYSRNFKRAVSSKENIALDELSRLICDLVCLNIQISIFLLDVTVCVSHWNVQIQKYVLVYLIFICSKVI